MKLVSDYRQSEALRNSFIQLAADIFGLNFKSWHEHGYWDERYIPFSYADGDMIVANVSVNELDFIIEGKSYKALQIGTVMTHPEYRNKGLSASLMNHVLDVYQGKYDFMYLFANDRVLDFYPKFGFEEVEEYQYAAKISAGQGGFELRKLELADDLDLIEKTVYERVPVSKTFSTANSSGITMYHILNVFPDHLYYHAEEDAVVIFTMENRVVQLYDVISTATINIKNIVAGFGETDCIEFHFTPDYRDLQFQRCPFKRDGALFVKTRPGMELPRFIKHPFTSEA
ncbi:GNAT family N-acetyltransferase [Mesobacillus selenatarsenatis]|uniref:Acetyltransferase, GNAT family, potentially associated with YqeK n=1 Tax=Mesobacillus selenatarsenatis (strain DSM 18680 / JCM 14380 / FERM P-15431 / SF-1) TaxID=1321606 RepID=A0A0A8XB61_MESS1|nr:GNAT family N-acetyltransferase [Mesobacillus selenatarsenatis]GAM15376.1 acetyltransferase, GNAT family, potentially associated with YqeK [Mesobacillus selenatarsenatis SF-1]